MPFGRVWEPREGSEMVADRGVSGPATVSQPKDLVGGQFERHTPPADQGEEVCGTSKAGCSGQAVAKTPTAGVRLPEGEGREGQVHLYSRVRAEPR